MEPRELQAGDHLLQLGDRVRVSNLRNPRVLTGEVAWLMKTGATRWTVCVRYAEHTYFYARWWPGERECDIIEPV